METLLARFRRRYRLPRGAVVEVTVAGDDLLERLNRRWRRRPGPTDVLAFHLGRDEAEPASFWLWGDVYVSLDRARAQARERKVRLGDELATLTAHGLLHLVGFHHRTTAARAEMEAATAALAAPPARKAGRGRRS